MTVHPLADNYILERGIQRTVQRNNAEDEDQGENQNYHGVDFQSWAFIGVESYLQALASYSTMPSLPAPIRIPTPLPHRSQIKVYTQHSAAAPTSACSSCRSRAGTSNTLLLVGRRTSSDRGLGSPRRCWAGGPSAGSCTTRAERRGCAGGRLGMVSCSCSVYEKALTMMEMGEAMERGRGCD